MNHPALCFSANLDDNEWPSPFCADVIYGSPPIGNNCYFNAVLQCLFALPAFVESVVEWCDQIDAAAVGGGKYRLLMATRMLAMVKMAGKQDEVG